MLNPRHRVTQGFTLVEILTATAIMAVIVGFVMTIMTQVLDVWNSSSDELELSGQAQVGLDLLKQDLQQAYFRHDGTQWMVLTTEMPQTVGTTGAQYPALGANVGTMASRLMLYAPTALRQTTDTPVQGATTAPNQLFGDVCAIEYRMTYGPLFAINPTAQPVLALHRAVLNPESTMLGLHQTSGGTGPIILQMGNISAGSAGASGNDLTAAWNTLDDATVSNGLDNPILLPPATNGDTVSVYGGKSPATTVLYNVAQFIVTLSFYDTTQPSGISLYSYSGAWYGGNSTMSQTNVPVPFGTIVAFPPLPTTVSRLPLLDYPGVRTQLADTTMLAPYNLAYADVTLTLITDAGATLFASSPSTYLKTSSGSSMGPWTQFLLKYGRTFTERVYFQNTPQ